MKGIIRIASPKIIRPERIIFLEPTRSIQRPIRDVATVNDRKYVVCIWPMEAEEAPRLLSIRGIRGATKLIPKARKKTVTSMGRIPFVMANPGYLL
jgi:hypothetical protein